MESRRNRQYWQKLQCRFLVSALLKQALEIEDEDSRVFISIVFKYIVNQANIIANIVYILRLNSL